MPYINTVTTVNITEEQKRALTKEFGKAIELIPGKSEEWLMLRFTGGEMMAFKGDCESPCAMIEVEVFGKAKPSAMEDLTKELCLIVERTLGVKSERVYVKFEEIDTWGYDGFNF